MTSDKINKLLGVNDSYKAPERIMEILHNKTEREHLFKSFLEAFDYDVSYDWFHDYFQDEHADRRKKKQNFTPTSVGKLLAELLGGKPYEETVDICAGTGGLTIQKWNRDRMQHSPFDYYPSYYLYFCEELSDRAIPFLLFNTMIRGMNAVIIHGDVISRKSYGVFFVQNDDDDFLHFSNLYLMPYTKSVEDFLGIRFVEERYKPIDIPGDFPRHIFKDIKIQN